MAHDFAQRSEVVFRFVRRLIALKTELVEVISQRNKDSFPARLDKVVGRVGRHGGFAGADEERLMLGPRRVGVGRRWRPP